VTATGFVGKADDSARGDSSALKERGKRVFKVMRLEEKGFEKFGRSGVGPPL
jgi:hypothetical protein